MLNEIKLYTQGNFYHLLKMCKQIIKWKIKTHSVPLLLTVSWENFFTFSLTTFIPLSSEAFSSRTLSKIIEHSCLSKKFYNFCKSSRLKHGNIL